MGIRCGIHNYRRVYTSSVYVLDIRDTSYVYVVGDYSYVVGLRLGHINTSWVYDVGNKVYVVGVHVGYDVGIRCGSALCVYTLGAAHTSWIYVLGY